MNWRIHTSKAIGVIGIICVCCLTVSSVHATVVGYWRFEADGGSAVTSSGQSLGSVDDSSGNVRTGTPIGSPQYITTPFANPVPLTGAANLFALNNGFDQGVLLSGAAASGLIGPNFTIEGFIQITSIPTSLKAIFRSRDGSSFPLGFNLVDSSGLGGPADDLQLVLPAASITLVPDINLLAGVNYHVAVTYDGTTAKMYVDGALVGWEIGTGFAGTSVQSAIGDDPQFPSGYNVAFPGLIDEFRISNVALAPSQFLDAVPEPATVMLLGLGGLLVWRRRK